MLERKSLSQIKKRCHIKRKEFKRELFTKCKENKALAVLITQTFTSRCREEHIYSIWSMFRNPKYREFKEDYTSNLMGRNLTGSSNIWNSLYFAERKFHDKYREWIPEDFAMGDALAVAYKSLKS